MLTIVPDRGLFVIVRLAEGASTDAIGEIVDVCASLEIANEDYPDAILQD